MYKQFYLTKSHFYTLINISNLNYFGGNMNKKISLFVLVVLLVITLNSCLSMGGPGVIFVQESHEEQWIKFYKIDTKVKNSPAILISNVSLKDGIERLAIHPMSLKNRAYWLRNTNEFFRSYEDSEKNVSNEAYFKSFLAPDGVNQIFIDWKTNDRSSQWRKDHFIYFIDGENALWGINNKTEKAERWMENVKIPFGSKDIYLLFEQEEYPVIYVGADQKPTRINSRTGNEQVYLEVIIENKMIPDEITGNIYEIEDEVGLVQYDDYGNKNYVNRNVLNYKIVAPLIINGVLYFGAIETDIVKTRGKSLL